MRKPPNEGLGDKHSPERTCILTRRTADRDELIRLALGPDGDVAPDVRARAPGRGAWIGVDRPTLEAAQAQGQAARRAGAGVQDQHAVACPTISARGSRRRCEKAMLDRLGLEARAGNLATGSERIETAARSGKVHALDPRRRCRRGGQSQARSGLAGRLGRGGIGPPGSGFPRGKQPYCRWRWAARMWYMSPSRIGPPRRVCSTRSSGGALLSDRMLG